MRLVFERIIFDHNQSPTAGAVFVEGRAGQPVPSEPSRQNWESGISWTVRACTFYRNFAQHTGALYGSDVWPMDFHFSDTSFIENQATLFFQHDWHWWNGYPGPERRSGFSSIVHTSSHYDGGFSTEGLYAMISSGIIFGDSDDDPDATTNILYDRTTFVDHASALWGHALAIEIWPPQSDQGRRFNLHLRDFEMTESRSLSRGDGESRSMIVMRVQSR